MSPDPVSDIQRQYLVDLAREGKRFDGRGFDEYRDITLETGLIKQAEGSARITLGETELWAGVKLIKGDPYSDTPDKGAIATNAELSPVASPEFESGPPRGRTIEVARVIDRGIRESGAIDLKKLSIEEGESCWVCFMDMHVVNYDGNLFDAGSLALMAALMTGQIPWHKIDMGDPEPIPIEAQPIMTTAAKIGDELVFDPTELEDKVARPRISISTDEDGNIRAGQKGLSGGLTPDEVKNVMKRGTVKAKELRSILLDAVKEN